MSYRVAVLEFKRQLLLNAIHEYGTVTAAARALELRRPDFIRNCRRVGIPPRPQTLGPRAHA